MILMYHNISEKTGFNTVSLSDFQQQLDFLSKEYSIVSMDKYIADLSKGNLRKNTLTLTFDDAYISFCERVLPLMVKFNYPATVFVPTGYIGKFNEWDKDLTTSRLQIMDYGQLKEVSGHPLVTIGSHGISHRMLANLSNEELHHEITGSKELLEQELGIAIHYFSYPFGQHHNFTKECVEILKSCSYKAACSTNWNRKNSLDDLYKLNRMEIEPGDTLPKFISKIASQYHMKRFKQVAKNILYT
jgi:poly-beta-1,6-N-acetyl-D-glucosamine N-deacetylase